MRIPASILRGRLVPLISLFLFFAFLSVRPGVAASSDQEEIKVLATLPLKDMQVNQMFGQQSGSKFYLYLHRAEKDVYALVDVTKPEKPILVERSALKGTTGKELWDLRQWLSPRHRKEGRVKLPRCPCRQ